MVKKDQIDDIFAKVKAAKKSSIKDIGDIKETTENTNEKKETSNKRKTDTRDDKQEDDGFGDSRGSKTKRMILLE